MLKGVIYMCVCIDLYVYITLIYIYILSLEYITIDTVHAHTQRVYIHSHGIISGTHLFWSYKWIHNDQNDPIKYECSEKLLSRL